MASHALAGEPGWAPAVRRAWPAFLLPVPFLGLLLARNADGLTRLRVHLLGYAASIVHIAVVLRFLSVGREQGGSPGPWVAICLGVGTLELGMVVWARRRPLVQADKPETKNDPVAIAGVYRAVAMLRFAFSMAAYLIGFVAVVETERFELIFLSAPFAIVGLFLSAPTSSDLARRQEELRIQGSSVDLVEAVKTAPWGRVESLVGP